jgi:Uma2 family endonuclease
MTVEEFYAFTDTRPDEEKWELIDGEPILNASPSKLHQRIVKNIIFELVKFEQVPGVSWEVLPSLGVRVSDVQRPEPDVLIIPKNLTASDPFERDRNDVIVAFEVLSPSTVSRDLRWKRVAYTSLSGLSHYVVIAQDAVDVVVFDRTRGFEERHLRSLNEEVQFPALRAVLPLAEIYRDTGLV